MYNQEDLPNTTLESLPNEILVKIVTMACYDKDWGVAYEINYPFIINVISTVSKRFEDVAADKSLWKVVSVKFYTASLFRELMDNYTGVGTLRTKELTVFYDNFHSSDMMMLADKFPNLRKLELDDSRIISWPANLSEPWNSVEELHLNLIIEDSDMFQDLDLSASFPNLTSLHLEVCKDEDDTIMLPDLSGCERLEEVTLASYRYWSLRFSFRSILEEKVPLPRGLKKLLLKACYFVRYGTNEDLDIQKEVIGPIKKQLEDCVITVMA